MQIAKNGHVSYSQIMSNWTIYILECADKTFYTGITTDFKRRVDEHNNGSASKYTRARLPVKPVFSMSAADRSEASQIEYKIKKMSRKKKIDLIAEKKAHLLLI